MAKLLLWLMNNQGGACMSGSQCGTAKVQRHKCSSTQTLPEQMSHFLRINQVIHCMFQAAHGPDPAADPHSNCYSRRIKFVSIEGKIE